jgi:hypothetical protein
MPVKIFFCYAHEDEQLLNELKNHLIPLKRTGLIEIWYDRDISAGTEKERLKRPTKRLVNSNMADKVTCQNTYVSLTYSLFSLFFNRLRYCTTYKQT